MILYIKFLIYIQMKTKEKIQKPQPIGYYSVCFYSLSGNAFPEENWEFNLHAKTYEGLVNKIKNTYLVNYQRDPDYKVYGELKGCYPKDHPTHFTFDAAYTFGPQVHYEIFIKAIYSEDLTD